MTMICFFLVAGLQVGQAMPAFETVAPGVEYRQVKLAKPRSLVISQLRCDPKQVRFSLLLASDRKGNSRVARAEEMLKEFQLTAVINCSYFDEQEQPLGYHERLGRVLNSEVASGGVFGGFFYWDGQRAGLKARDESRPSGVPVLFQAGPRLVWEGEPIPGLEKTALAARSFTTHADNIAFSGHYDERKMLRSGNLYLRENNNITIPEGPIPLADLA